MKQVEGTLQPIADDALRDDGDHVRVIDDILGHIHHRHLSIHQGMVQWPRSYHSLPTELATDVQCRSFHQCLYNRLLQCVSRFDTFD